MKATPINPAILLTPAGPYAQGIKIEAPTQWFVSTGQVAITADGSIVEGATEQSELVWKHLQALLSDAGMTLANVVKTNVYAVSADVLAAHNKVRNSVLGDCKPATTAVIVSGLANPKYLIEVDLIACR